MQKPVALWRTEKEIDDKITAASEPEGRDNFREQG